MHRLIRPLLPLLLCGAAHASPAWVVPVTKLYPVPNQTSAPVRTLNARTALNLNRCYALWCDVQLGAQRGWILREAVNLPGECLVRDGLRNPGNCGSLLVFCGYESLLVYRLDRTQ